MNSDKKDTIGKLSMRAFILDHNQVDRGKHEEVMDEGVKRSRALAFVTLDTCMSFWFL